MKKYIICLCAYIAIIHIGCKKDAAVSTPDDFNAELASLSLKAGDTATFNLSGAADMIVFYSGEAGRNYEYRNRTVSAGVPKLVFQSNMTQGLIPNDDSLRVYVSTDLKGYDSASVVTANWTDITNRNTKWPVALSSAFVVSDTIDLSDFNTADGINIAFRATGKKYATAQQRRRQIQNVNLTNVQADGSAYTLFSSFSSVGWVQANIKNNPLPSMTGINFHAWNVGEAGVNASNSKLIIGGKACNSNGIAIQTAYPITFDPGSAVNADENDDWLITSKVNLKTVRPDAGIAIKRPVDPTLKTYRYRFTKAGTYTVTFVAQNQRLDGYAEVVRKVQVVVNP